MDKTKKLEGIYYLVSEHFVHEGSLYLGTYGKYELPREKDAAEMALKATPKSFLVKKLNHTIEIEWE